jgi:nucleotide sugar dehydrogenase
VADIPQSSINSTKVSIMSSSPEYVCVVGVGYVGESLLREFSHVHPTIGYDISEKRINQLRAQYSESKELILTNDEAMLDKAQHYMISVPTLLKEDHSVDFSHLRSALSTVFRHARPGNTIVIESSVSVGTTRQLFAATGNLFHCGMSPERVDPGRVSPAPKDVPKIISALNPESMEVIKKLYSSVFNNVVTVSSPEIAEMTKLFENCYRMINIAYVNEVADSCRKLGLDPNEVIDAAATKPYGYQAFRPGLGVGGHCIPVNPSYLLATCPELPILEQSTNLMRQRPMKLARELYDHCVSTTLASTTLLPRVLVIGVGFKPGQSVLSNSPGADFASQLNRLKCDRLAFYDPLVAQEQLSWMEKLESDSFNATDLAADFDVVAICTRQHGVDFTVLDALPNEMVWSYD